MNYFFWAMAGIAAVLQILLIRAFLRNQSFKKFPLLFLFVIVLFLTNVADASAFTGLDQWTEVSRRYFWFNEAIRQSIMFAVVISLVTRALSDSAMAWLRKWLLGGAILFAALSVVLSSRPNLDTWMTTIIRNLSFCAVVLNFALWLALIRKKQLDRQLFLVSGGLGLQMAGDAIGYSLRQIGIHEWLQALGHSESSGLSKSALIYAGNVLAVLAHPLCLYVWWRAFRKGEAAAPLRDNAQAAR